MKIQTKQLDSMSVQKISTSELKNKFKGLLEISVETISEMAIIWYELKRREESLSEFKNELTQFLPEIAEGKLLPELVQRFLGRTFLIKSILKMPTSKQKQLVDLKSIEVVDLDSNYQETIKKIPVENLRVNEIYQVISKDGIRTTEKQKDILFSRLSNQRRVAKIHQPKIRFFEKTGNLTIGQTTVRLQHLLDYLQEKDLI